MSPSRLILDGLCWRSLEHFLFFSFFERWIETPVIRTKLLSSAEPAGHQRSSLREVSFGHVSNLTTSCGRQSWSRCWLETGAHEETWSGRRNCIAKDYRTRAKHGQGDETVLPKTTELGPNMVRETKLYCQRLQNSGQTWSGRRNCIAEDYRTRAKRRWMS